VRVCDASRAVVRSRRSVRHRLAQDADYVAPGMISTDGGSPSRSTVEPAVPPHFDGVVAVAVLG
jgi:hypothetical protein